MSTTNQIPDRFKHTALWHGLGQVRSYPRILRWVVTGCGGVAPHLIKMNVVRAYQNSFPVNHFVETGTYQGQTLAYMARSGIPCTSIELSPTLYAQACTRFQNHTHVRLIQGDSGEELPKLLHTLAGPTLFWLDGHYSSGQTARGELDTPISIELQAILNHPNKQHVILIDDARMFDGTRDYPHLDELLHTIRTDGHYRAQVSLDMIRLTPKHG